MTTPRNFRTIASPVQGLAQVGFEQRFQGSASASRAIQSSRRRRSQICSKAPFAAAPCLCRGQTRCLGFCMLLGSQRHVAPQVASHRVEVYREETGQMQTLRRLLKASENAFDYLTEPPDVRLRVGCCG